MLSSPKICSSTTWSARMPKATSSVIIARPASATRGSGTAPAISARKSAWPPPQRGGGHPIGGVVYIFVYPILFGERKAEQRMQSVAKTEPLARAARGSQKSRREAIELTLKEVEERHKKKKSVLLSARIAQAGLSWSKRQFAMISAGIGLGMFIIGLLSGAGLLVATGLGFAGAFGVPRWLLSYLKKRREKKFLEAFPDAVDIIVRGIKTGLPLLDCIKMITAEAPEPLKSEFRVIMETQAIMPLGEACAKLYERTPLPEANFFGIVVAIQQRAVAIFPRRSEIFRRCCVTAKK